MELSTPMVAFLIIFLYLCHLCQKYKLLLEMLSMVLFHFHRIYDKFFEMLQRSNGTFQVKGGLLANYNMLVTSDPENLHYVMSNNFSNYPKGPESKRIFDLLGDMLFNSDHGEWKKDRKMAHGLFGNRRFHEASLRINKERLEDGLIPVLDHVSKQGLVVDLQDLFERLMCDATCLMVTGYNPGSLCIGFPQVPMMKAVQNAGEALFMRFVLPEPLWRIQRWLGIGAEKKMSKAKETLDDVAAKYIALKEEQMMKDQLVKPSEGEEGFDALRYYLTGNNAGHNSYSVMRDTIVGLMFVGRGTSSAALTWLFWLISLNPLVESKILEEIKEKLCTDKHEESRTFDVVELNKLTYLHATLLETLRLFPPVPLQRRVAVEFDILPSGHRVNPNTKIVLCSYAIGRMKSIWGEDCSEFKPERWISEKGGIKLVATNKFVAFSSGPRICPGKELGFNKMKAVAAAIIYNYNIQVVKGHPVAPVNSILLHMKHGLKVMVTKRRP